MEIPQRPLKVKSIRFTAKITDQVAVTQVEQVFENDTPYLLEGVYFFPLPDNVSITEFAMWDGGAFRAGRLLSRTGTQIKAVLGALMIAASVGASRAPPTATATQTPGGSKLTVNSQGVFHYNWETLEEWAGTCREVVVTRDDGRQHRAFFRFI